MSDMITPTDAEVREAFEEYAAIESRSQFFYAEAEALKLAKVNLMLGTTPNGSITPDMLLAIVERLAGAESRLRDLERGEQSRLEREMGDDL